LTLKTTKTLLEPSPLLGPDQLGHWLYETKFRQSEWFGFIYCITRNYDKKFYIGKKQLNINGLKTKLVKGKRVPNTRYGKTTDWKTYTGSSDILNKDISELGKSCFTFEIIDCYKTKGGLYYAEAYLQMLSDALPMKFPNKVDEYAGYNSVIGAVRFIPKELPSSKTKLFAGKIKKRIKDSV
jgi:hypothetical protein